MFGNLLKMMNTFNGNVAKEPMVRPATQANRFYTGDARELGEERAVLCICRMDKEYSQGFHHIRYDRSSAVSEGARACEYRLRFDPGKD